MAGHGDGSKAPFQRSLENFALETPLQSFSTKAGTKNLFLNEEKGLSLDSVIVTYDDVF